jgi:hypothetical protein
MILIITKVKNTQENDLIAQDVQQHLHNICYFSILLW